MEKPFNRLCDLSINLNRLEIEQLQLHYNHCSLAQKDGLPQTGQDYH